MVHVVGFVPSHIFCEHGLFLSDIGHVRGRIAVPLIVTHTPGELGVLHAWQVPVHADVQHTWSTHWVPVMHPPLPPSQ
jgi:hypothetical protein